LGKFKAEGERARRDFAMDLAVWVLNRNAAEFAAAKDIFDEVFKHPMRTGGTCVRVLRHGKC
jgi:hypothetical protein